MIDEQLDYEIPSRAFVSIWVPLAIFTAAMGFWYYSPLAMLLLICATFLWVNLYSTILHYALDADEFTKLPIVGKAFVTFQSHHFPKWINTIHRKPIYDLVGELNPMAIINIVSPLLFFWLHTREVFVAWGVYMVIGSYAMICHRWAHAPASTKPRIATVLQRAHLALSPTEHWAHHAQAVNPQGRFVPNFDLSFGWSNPVFNRVLKVFPSPRFWLGFIAVTTISQVWALATLLHWLRR